ncbi:MAG: hypothetical protein ACK5UI_09910 [Bacteroidota bacterium]|jgi:hypothetical protein
MRFVLFCIIIWVWGLCQPVLAQTGNVFYGRTLGTESAEVVPLASIYNQTIGKRFISNRQGYFKVVCALSDTLWITSINYDSVIFVPNIKFPNYVGDTVLVFMKPKNIRLREVKILSSNPVRDSIARAAAEILKNDPLLNNNDRILNRNKGGLMSPITAMYEQFSKEGRDNARFDEFVAYMEKQKMVDRRYNRDFVKRATQLPDLRIDEFMRFCKLDKDFVLMASEYDLIKAVQECERNFNLKQQ